MKHLLTTLLLISTSHTLIAKTPNLRCFEIPNNSAKLYLGDQTKHSTPSKSYLITDQKANLKDGSIVGIISQHKKGFQIDTTYCMELENDEVFDTKLPPSYLWCGIECDGGGVAIDADMRHAQLLGVEFRGNEETNTVGRLKQIKPNNEITLKEFKCPSIAYGARTGMGYYGTEGLKKGQYVCYDSRSKTNPPEYYSCERTIKSCKSQKLQRFGRYASVPDAKSALNRCYESKPKFVSSLIDYSKKSVEDGKYICYNYKSGSKDSLTYHGCTQSKKSCKAIHKSKFGLYPSVTSAQKALIRCEKSNPIR